MSIDTYSPEELKELSMIELAYELMASKKQPLAFKDLIHEIAQILELTDEELKARMPQFYTDLNIDGRFLSLGENRWGLRSWYPYDQIEEEVIPAAKPKKKRAKKTEEDDDLDIEEYDELDEEYDELDEIDDLDEVEDDDDDDDIDDDDTDDDFDDDLLDDDEDYDDLDEDEEFEDDSDDEEEDLSLEELAEEEDKDVE
ncbi:DNA-directed RNA polymerase subunit delta [Bacillus salitolerans]|uniref:Probable DNA-directed RNA polymerase subunit delta n=1 Tax=Bacillus salitolerans TaxID=1437434 RepID=A0ABW4LKZ2_9BACI